MKNDVSMKNVEEEEKVPKNESDLARAISQVSQNPIPILSDDLLYKTMQEQTP